MSVFFLVQVRTAWFIVVLVLVLATRDTGFLHHPPSLAWDETIASHEGCTTTSGVDETNGQSSDD